MTEHPKLSTSKIHLLILAIIICFSQVSCKKNESSNTLDFDENKPFEIAVLDAKLIRDADFEANDNNENSESDYLKTDNSNENLRLNLTVSIKNKTDLTLERVQYKFKLNESAKPFIASEKIERISDDFFRVVPENSKELKHEFPVNGLLNVSGFEETWSPLITADEDLEEFTYFEPGDIYKNINMVTVTVSWDGGSQQEDISINLK